MSDLALRERNYFAGQFAAEAHGDDVEEAKRRAKAFAEAAAAHVKAIHDLAETASRDVPLNIYPECIAESLENIANEVGEIARCVVLGTEEGEPD